MKINLDLETIDNRLSNKKLPILIAGPCSAESEEQVVKTAMQLSKIGKVTAFRSGIWKPRTRPGMFEGVGKVGLQWLKTAKQESGLAVATEVASAEHVEAAIENEIDILWVGARSSVNPFVVQSIADALKGTDVTVMVKNPVNPDLQLWLGALERLNKAGIKKLAAIHRGFSTYRKMEFRNDPIWNIPLDLKTLCPNLPIICDPSHITGNRNLIASVSQKALDLNFDGLMIETHINPEVALSDAEQQITPENLAKIVAQLIIRQPFSHNPHFCSVLEKLRSEIDLIDDDLIHKFSARMKIAEKIGLYKRDNGVTIFQLSRWDEIMNHRIKLGIELGLSQIFMENLLTLIHQESIRVQTVVMNKEEK